MFVVEHGDAPATLPEHAHRFLEKFVARIERLALFVFWIPAVFADNEHGINREPRLSQCESLCDSRINLHAMPRLTVAAEVALRELIDVQRDQIHRRTIMAPLPAVPLEKAVDEMLRVRQLSY